MLNDIYPMIKDLLQSSFLHFLAIGAVIFLLYAFLNRDTNHPDGFDIHISEDQQVQIALAHQRNFGEIPDQATMDRLIAAEVKSEIYYREGLRLGLDENDEIIRRRLKQKYEFLIKDNADLGTIDDQALQDFYADHIDRYQKPAKYTFDHFYFSPDDRQDPLKDAKAFIQNPTLGSDPFHIASPQINKSFDDLRNEFGLAFVEGLMDKTISNELFHVSSGFGYHAIRLTNISKGAAIPLEDIRDQVKLDYQAFLLSERNKEAYEELKKEYDIEIEPLQ